MPEKKPDHQSKSTNSQIKLGAQTQGSSTAPSDSLLEISDALRSLGSLSPRPGFSQHSRAKILEALPEQPANFWEVIRQHLKTLGLSLKTRPVFTQAILALVLLISIIWGGYATVNAARPGDFLYPIDTGIEQIQVAFRTKPKGILSVRLAVALERLEEGEKELVQGHFDRALQAFTAYEQEMAQVNLMVANSETSLQLQLQTRLCAALTQHAQIKNRIMEEASIQTRTALQNTLQNTFQAENGSESSQEGAAQDPSDKNLGPDEDAGSPHEDPGKPNENPGNTHDCPSASDEDPSGSNDSQGDPKDNPWAPNQTPGGANPAPPCPNPGPLGPQNDPLGPNDNPFNPNDSPGK